MHNDGKVVPFNKATIYQAKHSPLARLPVILLQVRDKAAQQLKQGLQDLFDNADDTLFEMADRSDNSIEQNILFEAMRDLRLKRKHIERVLLEHLFEAFAGLGQCTLRQVLLTPLVTGEAQVHDERERNLAVDVMVGKAMIRDGFALGQLTARLGALTGQPLEDSANPLAPGRLCGYFLQAGRSLGVEIRVKLILLKLFEKYVLSDADLLYGEANQLLLATGVLPDLTPAPSRRALERQPARVSVAQPPCIQMDDNVQQVFSGLQKLLQQVRGGVSPTLDAGAQAQPISTRDLLRLLSHLQNYVPQAGTDEDFDLRSQLEQLLTRVSVKSGKSRVVDEEDEDVINLIALMFEFMLDDHTLPDSLKTLIARLQIPILKMAVLDKSFFSSPSHPARRLLNEIGAAANEWGRSDDRQRNGLYLRIEHIVQRLLNDFDDDPSIFSELLMQFLAYSDDEQACRQWLERQARETFEDLGLLQVKHLRVGTWIELQEDDENILRCKLTAILPSPERFIFVNRTGLKVLELSHEALVSAFARGTARALDDVLLFDRALASVIGSLQQLNHVK